MSRLFVVNNPKQWPLKIPGVEVISAKHYLTEPRFSEIQGAKVFNLCRSYRYQSTGYYVSLLAEARGHRPIPSIVTLQDMRTQTIVRVVSDDLDALIQKSFAPLTGDKFTLSIYFGDNLARRYTRLSRQLFNLFESPLLRAQFVKQKHRWQLQQIAPIAVSDIPDSHRDFVVAAAIEHFRKYRPNRNRRRTFRFDLAILHNPEEKDPPSDERALHRFCRAAESVGLNPELITRDDYHRIAEFDALFIRETTYVDHHTYRFSRRAAAEGLVVIDDPESIIRCTNKVYLQELFERHRLPTPKTIIVHRDNAECVLSALKLPCILKRPDSSFSQGVVKVDTPETFQTEITNMLEVSDLLIAQEFMPTTYDWRVGVLDGKALYACKYHMARSHWQIIRKDRTGRLTSGRVETFRADEAPKGAVRLAVRAAKLIGDGLYGADVKQVGRRFYIMEINDNPSIEAGYEDSVLKDDLYLTIMRAILKRIEKRKEAGAK